MAKFKVSDVIQNILVPSYRMKILAVDVSLPYEADLCYQVFDYRRNITDTMYERNIDSQFELVASSPILLKAAASVIFVGLFLGIIWGAKRRRG